jgi:hypothetical protein
MIYRGIVQFGTAEAFYEKAFGKILKERAESGVRQSSFDKLTLRDLKAFAVKHHIAEKEPTQGEEDFANVRTLLVQQRDNHGAMIAYKPPGYNVDDS